MEKITTVGLDLAKQVMAIRSSHSYEKPERTPPE
jgi:hypothetical protein